MHAFVAFVETVENMRQVSLRNRFAIIVDGDHDPVVYLLAAQTDDAFCVTQGVGDKILEGPFKIPFIIMEQDRILLEVEQHLQIFLITDTGVAFDGIGQCLTDIVVAVNRSAERVSSRDR